LDSRKQRSSDVSELFKLANKNSDQPAQTESRMGTFVKRRMTWGANEDIESESDYDLPLPEHMLTAGISKTTAGYAAATGSNQKVNGRVQSVDAVVDGDISFACLDFRFDDVMENVEIV
jgi:hypothetical protein